MSINGTIVEQEFTNIIVNVPLNVNIQTSGISSEILVRYGDLKLTATEGPDYAVVIAPDRLTFNVTPFQALLDKIAAFGPNVIYVSRQLPLTSDFDYDNAFVRQKIVDEFDRVWMVEQQNLFKIGSLEDANQAAHDAAISADAAATSAAAAHTSEVNAAASATAASGSAGSAAASATAAAGSASAASGSAGAASGSATAAASSASAAAGSASAASTSAGTATTQAGIATTQAGIATTQATSATNSATAANTSKVNAATSETNAAASAAAAAASAAVLPRVNFHNVWTVVQEFSSIYTTGATGGDKGAGTGNIGVIYENGTLLSNKYAPINNPVFTGDPQAPTPATADNDTSIATTAFVKAQGYASAAGYLPLSGGTLTGALVINPAAGGASLNISPTAAAQQAIINFNQTGAGRWQTGKQTDDSFIIYDVVGGVTIMSSPSNGSQVSFGRAVNVPANSVAATPAAGDRSTKIATTAFVGKGVTDGSNAAAGDIGEFLTANASSIALTANIQANIVSLALTAGDWDVWGGAVASPTGNMSVWIAGISTVSATLPAAAYNFSQAYGAGTNYMNQTSFAPPMQRVNLSAGATVYMVGQASFSTGAVSASAVLYARRRR